MKVIKISKSYRNGGKSEQFMVLYEEYSDEDVNYIADEWCDNDPNGQVYGYKSEWCYVEDVEVIANVLCEEILASNRKIDKLSTELQKMSEYLREINKKRVPAILPPHVWSGWIKDFDNDIITCILRKEYNCDKELILSRGRLTEQQNVMVSFGHTIRYDISDNKIEFMTNDSDWV